MDLNDRIKAIRKHFGLNQEDFGSRVGVGKSTIAMVESGKNNMSNQMCTAIVREFHVNEAWLRTGEGEMFLPKSEDDEIAELFAEIMSAEPGDEVRELAVMYSKLTKEQRHNLASAVIAMANAGK